MSESAALNWTLVVAVSLTLVHLAAPRLTGFIAARERTVGAFGSGLAVSYVFLHLIEEIGSGREKFGAPIHLVLLVGFVLYYGIEHYCETRLTDPDVRSGRGPRTKYAALLVLRWIYSWLIVYALPEAVEDEGIYIIPATLAIGVHMIHGDAELATEFPEHGARMGHWILATAPLVGWITDLFWFKNDPVVSDFLMAALAGSIIYNTFRNGLRDHRESSFRWMLIGVCVYALLHAVSD